MTQLRLDASFRSSRENECYLFVKNKFVVVNYILGGQKDELISGPINISDGFPILKNTPFENKIDCALTTDDKEVFLFTGDQCCRIDYVPNCPRQARILDVPSPIVSVFPYLKETVFVNGVDAALFTTSKQVLLFKGDKYARINYQANSLVCYKSISTAFTCWVGTVFECGIDSAFNSHVKDEAYIFRGKYWARINFALNTTSNDFIVGGKIKLIFDDWSSLRDILEIKKTFNETKPDKKDRPSKKGNTSNTPTAIISPESILEVTEVFNEMKTFHSQFLRTLL